MTTLDLEAKKEIGDAPVSSSVRSDRAAIDQQDRDWENGTLVGRTVTINRPRQDVYLFWRDVANLARVMENVERIDKIDDRRSHWVVTAPAGRTVEWDSVITEDDPGRLLAWESVEGADVRHTGRVEFRDGPPGRGTEVTATIVYDAPAGEVGRILAKLFQKEPKIQARRDLRRLKQFMETGEISTSEPPDAAPRA
ncbi:SRPBCC family protein [Roseiterribacter gracilis]|uniref:Cyclase n=1 Tax=Roseiterribacter gracilis TaxID=2812848 RepID=A0A8S8XBB9_9PROT|nr:cyclase [Rhodospirillales bacterium TMPK1]